MDARSADRVELVLKAIALTASALVVGAYLLRAAALIAYPWDWSPDEGLYLDYARRLLHSPASLHQKSFVPYPSVYGPGLPVLLLPAALVPTPLPVARLIMLGGVLLAAWATYALARRCASAPLSLAAVAFALTPFDLTFWHMLVRPDGPMLALWLLAALALLPRRLAPGADVLSAKRTAAGVALLLAAVLTKPTAVLHGAPLVLGWWWVDRRSAVRLSSWLSVTGLLVVVALQWATSGGFLWLNRVWGLHDWQGWQALTITAVFLSRAWPVLLTAMIALLLARRSGTPEAGRDGSLLLVLGGLAALPLTGKFGAWWNYLLPLLPALALLTVRVWAQAARQMKARWRSQPSAAAALASIALALAVAREFPLPTSADERTARVLYDYVGRHTHDTNGFILAIRPELAYLVVGQDVEMEGSGYLHLARGRAPGTETVVRRLAGGAYTLVIASWPLPADALVELRRWYTPAGACTLGYYYGRTPVAVLPRNDLFRPLPSVAGARCGKAAP